jgi:hypothetical protein
LLSIVKTSTDAADRDLVDLTLTPRIKVIALAGILAAVAMVGGMQMLARQSSAPAATPLPPIRHVVHPVAPAPKPAVTAKVKDRAAAKSKGIAPKPAARAKAKPKPAVTTPATAPPVTVAAAPTTPTTTVAAEASVTPGLPAPLAAALKKFPVVVIAVYDPQSQVDAIAYAEAQAGAQEARVGFVPVNVLDD